jgi:ferrous-iron efflux pump FieF
LDGESSGRVVAAARTSVVVASVLGAAKLLAAIFTGSVALAASFVDSLMDVFASSVNLVACRVATRRPDEEHRYGHGKAEGLAGMFQGAVVGFSAVYLIVESVRRLFRPTEVVHDEWGMAAMGFAAVSSIALTRFLRRTARATGSVALHADSAHYASDALMNLAVLGGLVLVRATGLVWIDAALGLAVAGFVLRSSWSVLRLSVDELMDRSSPADIERVREVVAREVPEVRGIHDLRTRRAGPTRFVDLHVSLDRRLSFPDAHRLSERVVQAIEAAFPGTSVQVHADPDPMRPDDLG